MVYRRLELLYRAEIDRQDEIVSKGEKWYIIRDKSSRRTTQVVCSAEEVKAWMIQQ